MHSVTIKDLMPALPQLTVLHYLISQSDGVFTAHCLDLDLISVGPDLQSAGRKLDRLVKAHIELSLATSNISNLATKAPQSYWKQFLAGTNVDLEPKSIHIKVPQTVPLVSPESEIGILARQLFANAA